MEHSSERQCILTQKKLLNKQREIKLCVISIIAIVFRERWDGEIEQLGGGCRIEWGRRGGQKEGSDLGTKGGFKFGNKMRFQI